MFKSACKRQNAYKHLPLRGGTRCLRKGRSPDSRSLRGFPSQATRPSGYNRRSLLQWRDRTGLSPVSLLSSCFSVNTFSPNKDSIALSTDVVTIFCNATVWLPCYKTIFSLSLPCWNRNNTGFNLMTTTLPLKDPSKRTCRPSVATFCNSQNPAEENSLRDISSTTSLCF